MSGTATETCHQGEPGQERHVVIFPAGRKVRLWATQRLTALKSRQARLALLRPPPGSAPPSLPNKQQLPETHLTVNADAVIVVTPLVWRKCNSDREGQAWDEVMLLEGR